MKKLGFLPRDFNLREFLVKSTGQQIAGYYDFETKTISLLNWVPPDRQEPILAHELTHALQDQNYDLRKWMKAALKPAGHSSKTTEIDNDDGATARKAVVEGQAMVVYVDYLLAPMGRNLVDTPDLIYSMEEPAVKAVADSQMLHDAPMILRESGSFAYNEGLIFEGELLHKGGRQMAFAGAFARPPKNSHEVLQPEAYIKGEKLPPLGVPDLKQLLGEQYEVYDSGGIGQLDVRALLKQYGERKNRGRRLCRMARWCVRNFPSQGQSRERSSRDHGRLGASICFAMDNAPGRRTFRALLHLRGRAALSNGDAAVRAHVQRAKLSGIERPNDN